MSDVADVVRGSSPHTRGALKVDEIDMVDSRIIPAYAGSTEQTERGTPDMAGSSPHTRGARHHHRHRLQAMGIIPAYAGSTEASRVGAGRPGDHPRIRGEHRMLQPVTR